MGNLKLLFLFVLKILQIGFFLWQNYQLKFTYEVHCPRQGIVVFFRVILHRWIFNWQISFLYFNFIGLMQCSKILSVISSPDWERTIWVMKLYQYFEFGPSSQDPFSFCQIQLALDTVQCNKNLCEDSTRGPLHLFLLSFLGWREDAEASGH
jgi:hypothetical protein